MKKTMFRTVGNEDFKRQYSHICLEAIVRVTTGKSYWEQW